jgi:hypothetical protein
MQFPFKAEIYSYSSTRRLTAKEVVTEKKHQVITAVEVGRDAYAREKSNAQRRNGGSVSKNL